MTPEGLLELIRRGESLDLEFKGESRGPLSDTNLVESVVCLANQTGTAPGWLLVGVEDDGRITGARPRHEADETDAPRVRLMIANRTRPSQASAPKYSRWNKATFWRSRSVPPANRSGRQAAATFGARWAAMESPLAYPFTSMRYTHGRPTSDSWTTPPCRCRNSVGTTWNNSSSRASADPSEKTRAGADQALLGLSNLDLAKALGAVETDGDQVTVRVLGLLLFGHTKALSTAMPLHEVAFQRLSRNDVEVNDFLRWPLLRIMQEMETRLRAYNREREILVGMARIGVPDYPPRAYREGVANALIHRDYTRLGAVHVQWHDDRLQISSPGGFPEGVHLGNVLVTDPRPRNPLLADAFKRAGIVERTARGIDTIFHEQLRGGRPAPSYERSTSAGVTLVLPGGEANTKLVRLLVEEERKSGPLSLQQLLILDHLWLERRMTMPETMAVIQLGQGTARRHLVGLIERGLVEARGSGRERSYLLSLATYRRLGAESEYVRRRAFNPASQERMVMEYVRTHGRITRRETKALCEIKPAQATRLLRRLVDKGELKMLGQKRGTSYTSARPNPTT